VAIVWLRGIAYAEGLVHCNGCNECRLLFFGPVLKELQKQFRAVVALVKCDGFLGAESDNQPCAGMSWLLPPSRGILDGCFASFG
jgi:hypothetical protein